MSRCTRAFLFPAAALAIALHDADAQDNSSQLVTFAGTSERVPGWGIDVNRRVGVWGVETHRPPREGLHWVLSVAYSEAIDRNACCGTDLTLSYRYRWIAPIAGGAYDLRPVSAVRLRLQAGMGPSFLQDQSMGTPPPGVSGLRSNWQMGFIGLKSGASLQYEGRGRLGGAVGVHYFTQLHLTSILLGAAPEGHVVPYVAVTWRRPASPRRVPEVSIDSFVTVGRPDTGKSPLSTAAERRQRDDRLARQFMELRRNALLRVSTGDTTIVGSFAGTRRDTAFLIDSAETFGVPLADITMLSVQVRRVGRSTLYGTLVGAALAGVVAGVATAATPDCDYCINHPVAAGVLAAIPGGVAGSLVGLVVGRVRRPWQQLFP